MVGINYLFEDMRPVNMEPIYPGFESTSGCVLAMIEDYAKDDGLREA